MSWTVLKAVQRRMSQMLSVASTVELIAVEVIDWGSTCGGKCSCTLLALKRKLRPETHVGKFGQVGTTYLGRCQRKAR